MKVHCPDCQAMVAAADVDLGSGWGKCAACHEVFELAAVLPGFRAGVRADGVPVERPFDARAVVEQSAHELTVDVPRQGFRASTVALAGFATFWLGFVAFWTIGALGFFGGGQNPQPMNITFASFSAPFWIAGFVMVGGVLWGAFGTKHVRIDENELTSVTRCLAWSRSRVVERSGVQSARRYVPTVNGEKTVWYGAEIVFEKGSYVLPADTEPEADWLVETVNGFLRQTSPRR